MKIENIQIEVPVAPGRVDAVWQQPIDASHLLILSHGAGAGMHHVFLEGLSRSLVDMQIAVLRFQFAYLQQGSRRPDTLPVALKVYHAVVQHAIQHSSLPIALGGKSFGGRMASHLALALEHTQLHFLVCYGFPLHPAGQPGTNRAAHLPKISLPTLFLQGSRDALADLTLLHQVSSGNPCIKVHVLPGADHSFNYKAADRRDPKEVWRELAGLTRQFALNP